MRINHPIQAVLVLLLGALVSACGPGQIFGPTLTPTPTITATPTLTQTPTATRTATPTRSITPTPACLARSGKWISHETSDSFGMPTPILTFTVNRCAVTAWEIWAYPAPEELMWWTGESAFALDGDRFSHDEDAGMGIFTFAGAIDSATSSHGTLFFPKGFLVVDYVLTHDVTIHWTATTNP